VIQSPHLQRVVAEGRPVAGDDPLRRGGPDARGLLLDHLGGDVVVRDVVGQVHPEEPSSMSAADMSSAK
jgi:hypothetical protein